LTPLLASCFFLFTIVMHADASALLTEARDILRRKPWCDGL
jgi:hypothetical protein